MLFSEIIGQEPVKERLLRSVHDNRVPHAQLFLGPEGCGNLPMALAFAQYLNCENKGENDACGICSSCVKAAKFIHPDIHFTFPFIHVSTAEKKEDKKEKCADWLPEWRSFLSDHVYGSYNHWIHFIQKENKQGNINAKECQDILHRLSLKTFESPFKILILWLPEFLEKEGNRLLKLIEEPPDQTIFLFVGHNPDRIINTILSRLQVVPFTRLSDEEITRLLQINLSLERETAHKVAVLSQGNMNRAIELLEVNQEMYTSNLIQWLRACSQKKTNDLFAWNDQFVKWGKEQQKHFFLYAIHFLREVMLLQEDAAALSRLTSEEAESAGKMSVYLSAGQLRDIMKLLDTFIYFIERNASSKILITQLSFSIMHIMNPSEKPLVNPFITGWDV